ncbi:MAG TPA: RNA polymerase sigma-54 factor, partial [Terriglobia bacterium]|nr:RNA polymerase sigma-54 factor [Terriglobia bacterium]
MGFLEPRLNLRVQQKQILTPGLVQMVSLLTLNKLELIDQIQQELVQNPVLEEGTEIVEAQEISERDLEIEAEAAALKAADTIQA